MNRNVFFVVLLFSARMVAVEPMFTMPDEYQNFAFEYANAVMTAEDSNVVVSPVSLQLAVSMLANGAGGNTLAEIKHVLHADDFSMRDINGDNWCLLKQMPITAPAPDYISEKTYEWVVGDMSMSPVVEFANGIWLNEGFEVRDSFLQTVNSYYEGRVDCKNLNSQATMDSIDSWVCDKTHGMIPSVALQPNEALRMILINCLYFSGRWKQSFAEFGTRPAYFYSGTQRQAVEMMQTWGALHYAHQNGFTAVKMFYDFDDKFSMTIMMPDEEGMPLSAADWRAARENMHEENLHLQLPRFAFDNSLDLSNLLCAMGMKDAFSPIADFSPLTPESVKVSRVKQLARIEVDEDGTKAAASTIISMEATGIEPNHITYSPVLFNHPFYFTVEDNISGAILFIGRVVLPETTTEDVMDSMESIDAAMSRPSKLFRDGRLQIVTPQGLFDVLGTRL